MTDTTEYELTDAAHDPSTARTRSRRRMTRLTTNRYNWFTPIYVVAVAALTSWAATANLLTGTPVVVAIVAFAFLTGIVFLIHRENKRSSYAAVILTAVALIVAYVTRYTVLQVHTFESAVVYVVLFALVVLSGVNLSRVRRSRTQ